MDVEGIVAMAAPRLGRIRALQHGRGGREGRRGWGWEGKIILWIAAALLLVQPSTPASSSSSMGGGTGRLLSPSPSVSMADVGEDASGGGVGFRAAASKGGKKRCAEEAGLGQVGQAQTRRPGLRSMGAVKRAIMASAAAAPRGVDSEMTPDQDLMVPDAVESFKEAVSMLLVGQAMFLRAGEHRWRGDILFDDRNGTDTVINGEPGARLWGQWGRRGLLAPVGEDFFCLVMKPLSRGSLTSLVIAHDTSSSFDACVDVRGGPWQFVKCKILSSNAQALRCSAKSESRLRRCGLGGLEAATEVSTQVFGPLLARYGVYALGSCVVTLQACVLENTGRTGGIGARVGGDSQVQLIGCMVRCNDVGSSVDHRGQLTVTGCTLESNAWAAWHTGPFPQKCKASLSDNTVIGREWFNDRRPSSDPPTYLKCCGARGCNVCYDSIDNRLAEKELMERAVLLNPELKEGSYDSEADWQVSEEHDKIVFREGLDGTITCHEETVKSVEEALRPPSERAANNPQVTIRMKKGGVPSMPDLEGLSAAAQWWDRQAARFI